MLLTQEPTFVILMVVTKEPTIRKIAATHAFQNHGMIYCYIPSSCESELQRQIFLRESIHSCMKTCNQSSCWEC